MRLRVTTVFALASLAVLGSGCKLARSRKNVPDASASAAMPLTPVPVTAVPAPVTPAAPVVTSVTTAASAPLAAPAPAPVDPNAMPAADRATFDKANQTLAEVQTLLAQASVKGGTKPAESDLKSRCEEIDAERAKVEARSEPEVKTFLETSKKVCSFEVPIFTANNALDQMRFSASQASRGLMCKVAEKDIAKARSVKPNDNRVRTLDTRWHAICR